jgi:hypothetical protein
MAHANTNCLAAAAPWRQTMLVGLQFCWGERFAIFPINNHLGLTGFIVLQVCDAIKGICRCPAGWQGDACDVPMRRPCSQYPRSFGFQPVDEPIDWSISGLYSRCSGYCDDDIGLCFCPSNTTYGRIPAEPHLPPGMMVDMPYVERHANA